MKYFIDTEYSERGPEHPVELISIAVVAEDGRELYEASHDFFCGIGEASASAWVRDNVLPLIENKATAPSWFIAERLRLFIGDDPEPEFWGHCCAYDYVILSQMMGGMERWPAGWPHYCRDLRQMLDDRGLHHVSQPDDAPHDARMDARWIRETFLECQFTASDQAGGDRKQVVA